MADSEFADFTRRRRRKGMGATQVVGGAADSVGDACMMFFDAWSYLDLHPDVAAQKQREPGFDLARHFLGRGRVERRRPSFLFDPALVVGVLEARGDRMAASDPLGRFLALAPVERFVPNAWFDAPVFRAFHADRPGIAHLSDWDAFALYVTSAGSRALSPNALFNEAAYRARYPDVAEAIRLGAHRSGFSHFLVAGCREGRTNLPGHTGGDEERRVVLREADAPRVLPWFDAAFYEAAYPDVRKRIDSGAASSALEHYLGTGVAEGRIPHPAIAHVLARNGEAGPEEPGARTARFDPWLSEEDEWPPVDLDTATHLATALLPQPVSEALLQSLRSYLPEPGFGGCFDAERYLAAHPDLRGIPTEKAFAHWREYGVHEKRVAPGTNPFASRMIGVRDVAAWRTGVNLIAPFRDSGGAREAEGLKALLDAAGIKVARFDVSFLRDPGIASGLPGRAALPFSINLFLLDAFEILRLAAVLGTALFDGRANVGVWRLAAHAVPRAARGALSAFDLIVVGSTAEAASLEAIADCPVRAVPFPVAPPVARLPPALASLRAAGRPIVVVAAPDPGASDAAGLDIAARLASRLQPDSFPVLVWPGDAPPPGCLAADAAPGSPEWAALIAAADALLCPHRTLSAPFDLRVADAAGIPIIASDVGAASETLAAAPCISIPGRFAEARDGGGLRFQPDETCLAAAFATLEASPDAPRETRRRDAVTPEAAARALKSILRVHACLGAERSFEAIPRFAALVSTPRAQCFDLPVAATSGSSAVELLAGALAPRFTIVTPAEDARPGALTRLYDALLRQTECGWEWCIVGEAGNAARLARATAIRRGDARVTLCPTMDAALAASVAPTIVLLDPGSRAESGLLAAYAARIAARKGRAMLLHRDGVAVGVRRRLLLALGGFGAAGDGAALLRSAREAGLIAETVSDDFGSWRIDPPPEPPASQPPSQPPSLGREAPGDKVAD